LVFLMLAVELYGFRRLEQLIMAFVFAIAGCYAIEIFLVSPNWSSVAYHMNCAGYRLQEDLSGRGDAGRDRDAPRDLPAFRPGSGRAKEDSFRCPTSQLLRKFRHLRYELIDVLAAMNGAWLINSAMIVMAAGAFFRGDTRSAPLSRPTSR